MSSVDPAGACSGVAQHGREGAPSLEPGGQCGEHDYEEHGQQAEPRQLAPGWTDGWRGRQRVEQDDAATGAQDQAGQARQQLP